MLRLVSSATTAVAFVVAAGCASYPAPVQRLSDTEVLARDAADEGAENDPLADHHLRLAREGIARARGLMQDADEERADYVLIRAKGDAELALAEARERKTRAQAETAMEHVALLRERGVETTSTTTTTSATIAAPAAPGATPSVTRSTTTTTRTTIAPPSPPPNQGPSQPNQPNEGAKP